MSQSKSRSIAMYMFETIIFLSLASSLKSAEFCFKDQEDCSLETASTSKLSESSFDEFRKDLILYKPCSSTNCSCFMETLESDLMPFAGGITRSMINHAASRGTKYVVFKKKLYRSKECAFPARCSGVEHFLKELLHKLPDSEFILNTRDWPQISKHFSTGPVFSFSKTPDYLDIQYPAWSFWEGGPAIKSYPKGLGRWDLMRKILLEASEKFPWDNKISKGFFRGSRTSEERDSLILLSRSHPNLVDAQYTKNQAWKTPADTLHAEPAEEVPLHEHCRYKYLFNFRGVAASFRFKHLFLCGSVVIHFGTEWTEFFYNAMKPWYHYVPMKSDSTQEEITSLLEYLDSHDTVANEIAQRGKAFIENHLRMKDIKCYWRQLIKRYSKLLKFNVTLDSSLEEVT